LGGNAPGRRRRLKTNPLSTRPSVVHRGVNFPVSSTLGGVEQREMRRHARRAWSSTGSLGEPFARCHRPLVALIARSPVSGTESRRVLESGLSVCCRIMSRQSNPTAAVLNDASRPRSRAKARDQLALTCMPRTPCPGPSCPQTALFSLGRSLCWRCGDPQPWRAGRGRRERRAEAGNGIVECRPANQQSGRAGRTEDGRSPRSCRCGFTDLLARLAAYRYHLRPVWLGVNRPAARTD